MSQNAGQDGQSFFGYVGLYEESAYAEDPTTAPSVFFDATSDNFSGDNAMDYLNTIRGRDTYKAEPGPYEDSGGVDLPVNPEGGIGYLLKGAFGSVTTSQQTTGVYQHTFTSSDKIPSYMVEVGVGNIDAVRHAGALIDSLELNHVSGERLTASVDLPAAFPEIQGSQASPSYSDLRNFMWNDAASQGISLDGTDRAPDIQEATPAIENNAEPLIREKRTASKAEVGERVLTVSLTLDFANMNVWKKFFGNDTATKPQDQVSPVSFNAVWTSPETIDSTSTQYSLEWDMPKAYINTHEATLNQNDLMAEDVELRAVVDQTAGYDAQAVLTNGVTSY